MTGARHSGILLHLTSLPGPHGAGDLGPAAYHFVDWLQTAQQSLWQVLPLGGVGPGHSPYMSPSAFAGNELLIDLEQLQHMGWLDVDDLVPDPDFNAGQVDYARVIAYRRARLKRAAQRFLAHGSAADRSRFEKFCSAMSAWLDDYALFMALDKQERGSAVVWQDWEGALVRREPAALQAAAAALHAECAMWKFCQWCFHEQWARLKAYASARGVRIIGDMPIFVSPHSADVWAHPALFELDESGRPTVVAGVPPDYFSASGQHWGNPLYRWSAHAEEGFRWWVARLRHTLALCDIVRIDHFRGFESYWAIPADAHSAIDGQWQPGPGLAFFDALYQALGIDPALRGADLPIIAEDLGVITPAVKALRAATGLPGMRILQFAFDGEADNPYLPHNFEADTVVYSGTHDNDTSLGWWQALTPAAQDYVRRYLGVSAQAIHWDLIRAASASVARLAIVPMQDVLGLDSSARMNQPGVAQGSWTWRFDWAQVSPWHAEQLAALAHLYGRSGQARSEL